MTSDSLICPTVPKNMCNVGDMDLPFAMVAFSDSSQSNKPIDSYVTGSIFQAPQMPPVRGFGSAFLLLFLACSNGLNQVEGNIYGSPGEYDGYPGALWTFSEDERCYNSLNIEGTTDNLSYSYEGWECYDQEFLGGESFDENSKYDFILKFNREEMPIEPPGSSRFDEDLADDGYVHDNLCLFPDRSGLYVDYLNDFEYEGFCSVEAPLYLYEGDVP